MKTSPERRPLTIQTYLAVAEVTLDDSPMGEVTDVTLHTDAVWLDGGMALYCLTDVPGEYSGLGVPQTTGLR